MKTVGKLLLILMLPGLAIAAGPANDVGVTTPAGTYAPAAFSATSSIGTSTQQGRIFRDSVQSECVPAKVYPGIFNASTTYNYSTFTLYNNGGSQCVTVNFDPDAGASACGTNAHVSAYLNTYDPANQATNYLGDVGSSQTQPFSFQAPAGARIILVVTNTSSAQPGCTFALSTNQLDAALAPPPGPVPTMGAWGLGMMSLAVLCAGWLTRRRFLRQQ
jgi:hypothetical protein